MARIFFIKFYTIVKCLICVLLRTSVDERAGFGYLERHGGAMCFWC